MRIFSPKVIFILLGIVLIAIFSWFFYFSPKVSKGEVFFSKDSDKISAKDSDSDGLPDWQEIILNTDPNKADSDGNGIPDGEEAKLAENTNSTTPEGSPNLTEAFTQAFASSFGPKLLEEGGLKDISKSDLGQVADYAIPDPKAILGDIKVSKDQIKTSSQNDPASVKKYFNELHRLAYEEAFKGVTETDLIPFIRYLKTENPKELAGMDPAMAAIEKSILAVKNLAAPKGYESFAVTELEFFLKIRRADEILREADKDLIKAVAIVKSRFQMEDDLNAFHAAYKKVLSEKGIVFGPSEPAAKIFK